MTPRSTSLPALHGAGLALLAALLFGISTPLVQHFGRGLGGFTTAALLYAGAAAAGRWIRRPAEREARVRPADAKRLVAMALFGAVIGPAALAWGLQHTDGTGASLMLTLEAVFTAVLARICFGETLGRRVVGAMTLLTAGGALLVIGQARIGTASLVGLLAVVAATAAWGVDNVLSRPLAMRDPGQVVMWKSALGAAASAVIAFGSTEPLPSAGPALALLVVGATGYGLSLRCYLLAQRAFGAARTGSVFAFAPFIGALVAAALGQPIDGAWLIGGAALMGLGVVLHLMERHDHLHEHAPEEHEHAHHHDRDHNDGHHMHEHDPMPTGPHSHVHQHAWQRHSHAHVPDEHHAHRH